MILFPSVDKLLERVDSRYSLIMLASKRAHEIDKYRIDKWRAAHPDKAGETVSLEGDEAGLVTIDPDQHEDLQD